MDNYTPASANATRVFYCIQDEAGALPATPNFKQLSITSSVPTVQRDLLESSELDGSAEKTAMRLGSYQVNAEHGVELSAKVHDDLLQAAMQSAWQLGGTIAGATVTIDSAAKTATVTDVTGIEVGDFVKFPALTLDGNYAGHQVTAINGLVLTLGASKQTAPAIGVIGLTDETGTTDIVINDKLMVGTERTKVALLVEYGDLPDNQKHYDLVLDAECTGFAFNLAVNAITTGTLSFIGKTFAEDSGLPAGATLTPSEAHRPFTGIDGAAIREGERVRLSTSADLTLERNATAMFELGSKYMSHISYGKANNTVSIGSSFVNYDTRMQFAAEVEAGYTFSCGLDGALMAFNYPACIISAVDPDVSEGDISQTVSLQAYKPADKPSSLIIRRLA